MTIWIPEKAGRRAREELSTKGFERDFSALSRAAGARERGLRVPRFIVAGEDSRAEELLGWSKGCKGRCPMQTGKEDNGRSHGVCCGSFFVSKLEKIGIFQFFDRFMMRKMNLSWKMRTLQKLYSWQNNGTIETKKRAAQGQLRETKE